MHPWLPQPVEAVLDDRIGKLEIAVFHRPVGKAVAQALGKAGELAHRPPVAAAMPTDHQAELFAPGKRTRRLRFPYHILPGDAGGCVRHVVSPSHVAQGDLPERRKTTKSSFVRVSPRPRVLERGWPCFRHFRCRVRRRPFGSGPVGEHSADRPARQRAGGAWHVAVQTAPEWIPDLGRSPPESLSAPQGTPSLVGHARGAPGRHQAAIPPPGVDVAASRRPNRLFITLRHSREATRGDGSAPMQEERK